MRERRLQSVYPSKFAATSALLYPLSPAGHGRRSAASEPHSETPHNCYEDCFKCYQYTTKSSRPMLMMSSCKIMHAVIHNTRSKNGSMSMILLWMSGPPTPPTSTPLNRPGASLLQKASPLHGTFTWSRSYQSKTGRGNVGSC
ncbi:hypothetical protein L211DRAFT_269677 [Terfezia boudieri ATCC MYA-4762]|uniref:Uncharacterized protein n=1 Tax=Terfezia boudieri ATCC MYA-4762 TaxID=1051890 RepID=A0A3N4LP74_9PEZI|nr:hypothetical protein L211DRAFT_269677 [Terfezia boudieri ATCC MYA-4762]